MIEDVQQGETVIQRLEDRLWPADSVLFLKLGLPGGNPDLNAAEMTKIEGKVALLRAGLIGKNRMALFLASEQRDPIYGVSAWGMERPGNPWKVLGRI